MENIFKRKLIYALLGASLLAPIACSDDFLEAPVTAQLTESQTQSRAGLEALLIGVYSQLNGHNDFGWFGGNTNWLWGSIRGGDANKGSDAGDFNSISPIQRFTELTPTNNHPNEVWRNLYEGISRANFYLKQLEAAEILLPDVPDFDSVEDYKLKRSAEARFLRAHYYFHLRRLFKNVPYITPDMDYSTEILAVAQPNNVEIYPMIEADMKYAADNLPPTQPQVGRANSWAAKAYLGKIYLYQNKHSEALPLFTDVINNGVTSNDKKYGLVPSFSNVFRGAYENNEESVFAFQAAAGVGSIATTNHEIAMNYPYNTGPNGPGECCGFYQPSFELANSYRTEDGLPLLDKSYNDSGKELKTDMGLESEDAFTPDAGPVDPRLDHTIGRRGIMFLDWQAHPGKDWIRDQRFAGPYTQKKLSYEKGEKGTYQDGSSWTPGYQSINTYIIRFADVLLMAAEAEVEVGSLENARTYVNLVRARAAASPLIVGGAPAANYDITTYTNTWADQELARNAVRFERKLELALEGHRFFDLVRWGIAEETLNAYFAYEEQKLILNIPGSKFTAGKHEYLPIPQRQIDLQGTDILSQNPGY